MNQREELPLNVDFDAAAQGEAIQLPMIADVSKLRLHDSEPAAVKEPPAPGVEPLDHPLRETLSIYPAMEDGPLPSR